MTSDTGGLRWALGDCQGAALWLFTSPGGIQALDTTFGAQWTPPLGRSARGSSDGVMASVRLWSQSL